LTTKNYEVNYWKRFLASVCKAEIEPKSRN